MTDLTHLKAGDYVAVKNHFGSAYSRCPQQTTKRNRFKRANGKIVGCGYSTAIEATEEIIERVEKEKMDLENWNLINKVYREKIEKCLLTSSQLQSLADAIKTIME